MDTMNLANLINKTKDAVDRSCFGPMFNYPDAGNVKKKEVNQLCFMVFTQVLGITVADALAKERGEIERKCNDRTAEKA